jgi:hypothetical protein
MFLFKQRICGLLNIFQLILILGLVVTIIVMSIFFVVPEVPFYSKIELNNIRNNLQSLQDIATKNKNR